MSRFSPYSVQGPSDLYTQTDRLDELCSLSGSDDGSVSHENIFSDLNKVDIDADDDVNGSLTSQTLNVDGTPKRPMNAFMIFARRRRPQVSSENQAMRTGEISKILSKEWNAMPPLEKQFYLDQAKLLKDNFNSKYPDYVYRRRPNNSRKRRRGDAAASMVRHMDLPHASDDLRMEDVGDSSQTDGEDSLAGDSTADAFHLGNSSSGDQLPPRHASFSYPMSAPSFQNPLGHRHRNSLPYTFLPNRADLNSSPQSNQMEVGFPPNQPLRRASLFHPRPTSSWEDKLDQFRSTAANFFSPSHAIRPTISTSHQARQGSFSMSSGSSWPSPASSVFSSSTDSSLSSYTFPALTSPFFPNQTTTPNAYDVSTSLMSSMQLGGTGGRQYEHVGPLSRPGSPAQFQSLAGSDSALFLEPQPSRVSNATLPRALAVQSLPELSQAQSPQSPSSVPQINTYWGRDRIEGQ